MMSDTTRYDEKEAQQTELIYETPAAVKRRRRVREQLGVQPTDKVLSIGCGPGFEPAELATSIHREGQGQIYGIDRSEAMHALARARCADLPQVSLARADAVDLPLADETIDAAACVQVLRYVEEIRTALEELFRVLRPGGRAVIYDTDSDLLVWHSSNRERMQHVLEAAEYRCPWPHLGSQLASFLRDTDTDVTIERVEPNTILNTQLKQDTFASQLIPLFKDHAAMHDELGPQKANAWSEDLYELDRAGRTFFSFTQHLYIIRKPE